VKSRERRPLLDAESGVAFGPPGMLVYRRGHSLMAQRFDPGRRRLGGQPVRFANPPSSFLLGESLASISANGLLVFPTDAPARSHVGWIGRDGRALGNLPLPVADYREVALSPDQHHIALLRAAAGGSQDIWIADATSGALSQLTTDGEAKHIVQWLGDNERIAYQALPLGANDVSELVIVGLSGERRSISSLRPGTLFTNITQLTSDGATLVYDDLSRTTQRDLWFASLTGDPRPTCYLRTPFSEFNPHVSPDGRWIAYVSDESGRPEVYVQSFPTAGQKVRVSSGGGALPTWRADGGEICYQSARGPMAVTWRSAGDPQASPPRLLFAIPPQTISYAATADFKRFLVIISENDTRNTSLTLLANWSALMEK
jgi:hypothetical protein